MFTLLFQDYQASGLRSRLSDYHVKPNSTIRLVVMLYEIPEKFNHVVFDLYWDFPDTGTDHLDATCLLLKGKWTLDICDFQNNQNTEAVYHSGDHMDYSNKKGHHTINVALKKIPSEITHLFFTLSAWNSPNIAKYPNPSLRFYEKDNPGEDLCKTTFQHAGSSQAVIMCSVSRNTYGRWEIFDSGQVSKGNAMNYEPLMNTIASLIGQGV